MNHQTSNTEELQEQIETIVHARFGGDYKAAAEFLALITAHETASVQAARVDECEKAITEYNRFQEYYSAGSRDLQYGNKFLLNRLTELQPKEGDKTE